MKIDVCHEAYLEAVRTRQLERLRLVFAILASLLAAATGATEQAPDLRTQIQALAEHYGFVVSGLEKLNEEPGKSVQGDASNQLRELLRDYSYLAIHDDLGHLDKLFVTDRKRPATEVVRNYGVKTTRRGAHHLVRAILVGPSGVRRTESLIVDTGATDVVLPHSMSRQLGFQQVQLRDGWSQTANGRVRTKRGVISSLQVGQFEAENVTVNFVEDEALGGVMLLGMSFLGRFQVTIDDENDRLVLMNSTNRLPSMGRDPHIGACRVSYQQSAAGDE